MPCSAKTRLTSSSIRSQSLRRNREPSPSPCLTSPQITYAQWPVMQKGCGSDATGQPQEKFPSKTRTSRPPKPTQTSDTRQSQQPALSSPTSNWLPSPQTRSFVPCSAIPPSLLPSPVSDSTTPHSSLTHASVLLRDIAPSSWKSSADSSTSRPTRNTTLASKIPPHWQSPLKHSTHLMRNWRRTNSSRARPQTSSTSSPSSSAVPPTSLRMIWR